MKAVAVCLDRSLRHRVHMGGGPVVIGPAKRISPTEFYVTGSIVADIIRALSVAPTRSAVDQITFRNLMINGPLDLTGMGDDGVNTVPRLRLVSCQLRGALDFRRAVLRGLTVKNCEFCGLSDRVAGISICARNARIEEELNISYVWGGEGTSFDFTGATLKQGARLRALGMRPGLDPALGERAFGVPIDSISFRGASVLGDLLFASINIDCRVPNTFNAQRTTAINLERASITGSLIVTQQNSFQSSEVQGQINLRGATIGGRLRFEGVRIEAKPAERADVPPPAAVFARLAKVAGDFLMRPSPENMGQFSEAETTRRNVQFRSISDQLQSRIRWPDAPILIFGQLDVSGAEIGGDVHLVGFFAAKDRIRAIKAQRAHITRNLRLGHVSKRGAHAVCAVNGECDFAGARIDGSVLFSGSKHRLTTGLNEPDKLRYRQGQALNLRDAIIGRDLAFESSLSLRCRVQGVSLIGATVGGRLLISGTLISAKATAEEPRKAITANGSKIRGGVFLGEDEFAKKQLTTIRGDIRIRNALIGGPFVMRGVKVTCAPHSASKGVAIWANNTHFGSDLLLRPNDEGVPTLITGEVRLWGATLDGTLFIEGAKIVATPDSGAALDCYTADFRKGVSITDFPVTRPGQTARGTSIPTTIVGLVSFNFGRVQSLEVGSKSQATSSHTGCVQLRGALLLRDLQVQGMTILDNVALLPAESIANEDAIPNAERLAAVIAERLKQWQVYRKYTIVHANYANLGTRLFISVTDNSRGLISLYGAAAGTIGALSEKDKRRENYGYPPNLSEMHAKDKNVLRGRPIPASYAETRVLLNLEQFTYKRLNDVKKLRSHEYYQPSEPQTVDQLDHRTVPSRVVKRIRDKRQLRWVKRYLYAQFWWNVWHRLLGRPRPAVLYPRFDWLQHQIENEGARQISVVAPYMQIAKTYRESGELQRSYDFIKERRWIQIQNKDISGVQRIADRLFSAFFGFGYSPKRATITLVMLFGASVLFIQGALISIPQSQTHAFVQTTKLIPVWGADKTRPPEAMLVSRSVIGLEDACVGSLCDYTARRQDANCHLPRSRWDPNVFTEAAKLIIPFTRFETNASCSLYYGSSWPLRLVRGFLLFLSWVIFPLAAITYSGISREKPD